MNTMKTFMMAGLLAGFMLVCGCEKTTTSKALDVTPAASELGAGLAVVLTASVPAAATNETRQLYYPLEWTVSNGALGSLRDAAGDTAVYVAGDAEGVNTVTVRDQAGAEGVASITQDR